nr:probable nucleolar protein 5-2 [Ipomoea batatas]
MELMRGLRNQLTELISGLAVQDLAPMSLGLCLYMLAKIVQDNILYAKTVKLMGDRTNAAKLDFSEIFPEDVEAELKGAAMISMGTEVSDIHLMKIKDLCNQVLSFSEYTAQLYDYLKSRMNTIAPNLTALVLRFLNTPNQMR